MTAEKDAEGGWMPPRDELAALSTNSVHRYLSDATHQMVVEDRDAARQASRAILEVVNALRTNTLINGPERSRNPQ